MLFPRTVCECAVGPLDISIAPGFSGQCEKLLLVEPLPMFAQAAKQAMPHALLIESAVGFEPGRRQFMVNGGSSYLFGTWAPTGAKELNTIEVNVITFDSIDDGQIDIMNLDCEGQEWAVLSKMKSRPKLFVIEIWEGNPYKEQIFNWLEQNKYDLKFATGPTAETHLYAHPDYTQ